MLCQPKEKFAVTLYAHWVSSQQPSIESVGTNVDKNAIYINSITNLTEKNAICLQHEDYDTFKRGETKEMFTKFNAHMATKSLNHIFALQIFQNDGTRFVEDIRSLYLCATEAQVSSILHKYVNDHFAIKCSSCDDLDAKDNKFAFSLLNNQLFTKKCVEFGTCVFSVNATLNVIPISY